jgi:hypothetical protein
MIRHKTAWLRNTGVRRPHWVRNEVFSRFGKGRLPARACEVFWGPAGRSGRKGRDASLAATEWPILQSRRARRRTKQTPQSQIQHLPGSPIRHKARRHHLLDEWPETAASGTRCRPGNQDRLLREGVKLDPDDDGGFVHRNLLV